MSVPSPARLYALVRVDGDGTEVTVAVGSESDCDRARSAILTAFAVRWVEAEAFKVPEERLREMRALPVPEAMAAVKAASADVTRAFEPVARAEFNRYKVEALG